MSDPSFIKAFVFDIPKEKTTWFKARVADQLIMVFYPDSGSITPDMIRPGDLINIIALRDLEKKGACSFKANCAGFDEQPDEFKRLAYFRKTGGEDKVFYHEIKKPVEKTPVPVAAQLSSNPKLEFNGTVTGKENVAYVKAMQRHFEVKHGVRRNTHAITQIVERARAYDAMIIRRGSEYDPES